MEGSSRSASPHFSSGQGCTGQFKRGILLANTFPKPDSLPALVGALCGALCMSPCLG